MAFECADLASANILEFLDRDSGLLCRIIAEPEPPERRPDQTDCAEDPEDGSPAPMAGERDEQNRRESSAKAACAPDEALGSRMLLLREPLGDDARRVRISAGCADPEQESCADHLQKTSAPAGQGCEAGPPDREPREA